MNKLLNKIGVLVVILVLCSGCYTYEMTVGNGPQQGVTVTEKNHYVVYGLAAISTSNPAAMAGGNANYSVKIEHTFVDGLINSLTFGIYTPTTTTVTY